MIIFFGLEVSFDNDRGDTQTLVLSRGGMRGHVWFEDGEIVDLGDGNFTNDPKVVFSDMHYHLEVNHTRYILNRLPWDYKSEDLVTLCNHYHTKFHQHNKVPVYSEDESIELE